MPALARRHGKVLPAAETDADRGGEPMKGRERAREGIEGQSASLHQRLRDGKLKVMANYSNFIFRGSPWLGEPVRMWRLGWCFTSRRAVGGWCGMGSWLERWMEGKRDGYRKEADKAIQQARATDAGGGADDGVLGDCDSDVLAVNSPRRQVGGRRAVNLRMPGL